MLDPDTVAASPVGTAGADDGVTVLLGALVGVRVAVGVKAGDVGVRVGVRVAVAGGSVGVAVGPMPALRVVALDRFE
jgi:hypothetical protein